MCRRSTDHRCRHHSHHFRRSYHQRCLCHFRWSHSPCWWCHRSRSGLAGQVPPRKRPPPPMRRSRHHHRRHHRRCCCLSPVASSTSPWTPPPPPLLPHLHTCACSPWKLLDSSTEWTNEKCRHSGYMESPTTIPRSTRDCSVKRHGASPSNGHSSDGH
jgi:hypothetical protein